MVARNVKSDEKKTAPIDRRPPDVFNTATAFPDGAQSQGDQRALAQQRASQYLPELNPATGNPLENVL